MKKKPIKLFFDFLAVSLGVCIIGIVIVHFYINPKKLERESIRYTFATITGFFNPSDGPRSFNFIFIVKQKSYEGSTSAYKTSVKKGDKLLVRFLESDPRIFELVNDIPISDTAIQAPEDGWGKQPF